MARRNRKAARNSTLLEQLQRASFRHHAPQPPARQPHPGEVLSAAQCAAWRSDGAIFLSELLPPALADGIVEAAAVLTDPERGSPLRFPHTRRIALCNDAALELRLLRAAAQLLGVEDDQLRLTQSVVNADFAGQSSGAADPGMHRDLEENSLVALLAELGGEEQVLAAS